MEELNYYDLNGLIELCVNGSLDMHEPLEVSNRMQNQKIEISILKHLLIICERDNHTLIHILSMIRSNIKENILTLLSDNIYFKRYLINVIQEWGSEIMPEDLFNDGLNKCGYREGDDILPYEELLNQKKISNETSQKLEMIEQGIKERQESYTPVTKEYAEDIQNRIKDLHSQCSVCMDKIKEQRGGALDKLTLIEPEHRDILLDLSIKPKALYIEYLNIITKEESSVLSGFMTDIQNVNIPDNIHTIFLNYVITINMLKKEINYVSNSFKQIMIESQPRLQLLNKFTDGSDELNMLVIDEDKSKQVEESSSGFGFSFF